MSAAAAAALAPGGPVVIDGALFGLDAQVAAWVEKVLGGDLIKTDFVAIGLVDDSVPSGSAPATIDLIGGMYYHSYVKDCDIEAAVAVHDAVLQDLSKHKAAIRQITDYAFGILNLPRITVEVVASNQVATNAAVRLGFKLEGRKRKADRGIGDTMIFGLLREDAIRSGVWWST
jgi:hypothetical protein